MSTARERLDLALLDLSQAGERPRCGWGDIGHWWTSEDPEERARAARRCQGCPLLDICGAAADEMGETFGVWAGVDRTSTKRKRKSA